jgi:hypothetical protein
MKINAMLLGIVGLGLTAALAHAEVGVDFDIHLGNRSEPPPPVVVGPPAIVVGTPPELVFVSDIGIYVAVGIPYDLFFQDNVYYYHVNGVWYRSASYGGPWVQAVYRGLPPGLQRHRIEKIREFREHAWADYREHGEHYKGKHFRAKEAHEMHGRGEGHGRKGGHSKQKHR